MNAGHAPPRFRAPFSRRAPPRACRSPRRSHPYPVGDPIRNRFSASSCGMPSRAYIPDKPNLSSIRNPWSICCVERPELQLPLKPPGTALASRSDTRLVHRLSQSRHSGNLILNTKQRVAPAHGESFVWIGALGLSISSREYCHPARHDQADETVCQSHHWRLRLRFRRISCGPHRAKTAEIRRNERLPRSTLDSK